MTYRPLIKTQTDLEGAWRTLIKPLGFSRESLWFMFIGPDGVPIPVLNELDDAGDPPAPEAGRAMAGFLRSLSAELAPGAELGVAFLRSRPGGRCPTQRDRAWAVSLYTACRAAGLPCEVVHLATDHDVRPLPWDEVGGAIPA